ncbi:unnamed protein product, partial [Brenthis ino]
MWLCNVCLFPASPWTRLHADFADCDGKRFLIIIDAYSKWIEVIQMNRTDAVSTIEAFRSIFARFGLPSQLVTDNGPPFSSQMFKEYCYKNCIKHSTSAPYRPQANGAAENAVKTIKKVIKRAVHLGENISQALSKFLFQYRNCEHTTTAVSPAVALLGRRLRGRLDALGPDVGAVVLEAQSKQVNRAGGTNRELQLGDTVLTRDYTTKGEKWSEGTVTKKTGPVSFKVDVGGGVEWRRHQDQMIQLGNRKEKNRYSLARTSTTASADANEEQTPGVDDDADDQCSEAPETGANAGRALRSPGLSGPAGEPATPPPPPDASARAIRAYKRAIIQKDKNT